MPALLSIAEWSINYKKFEKEEVRSVLQTSILASLSIIISTLPSFLSPYINSLLNIIHSPELLDTSSALVMEGLTSLRGKRLSLLERTNYLS